MKKLMYTIISIIALAIICLALYLALDHAKYQIASFRAKNFLYHKVDLFGLGTISVPSGVRLYKNYLYGGESGGVSYAEFNNKEKVVFQLELAVTERWADFNFLSGLNKKQLLLAEVYFFNPDSQIDLSDLYEPTELKIDGYDHSVILLDDYSEKYSNHSLTAIDRAKGISIYIAFDKQYFSKQQSLRILARMVQSTNVSKESLRDFFEQVKKRNP